MTIQRSKVSSFFVGSLICGQLLALTMIGCEPPEPVTGDDTVMPPPPPPPPPPPSEDPDCPRELKCEDIPAAYKARSATPGDYGNYDLANRPKDGMPIRYIVIHTTEGAWDGVVSHFQNPTASAAAHYLVGSTNGRVAKFVAPSHVAWHAGNWYFNMH
ncbi:MAG TPA: N-acetylmuramoyl-L-alanine amidase, partial [Pseudomonadota bacterium]|nr:N-acetylmuramoyl-L-alanine amidase [Pseudomonadota bacterium]